MLPSLTLCSRAGKKISSPSTRAIFLMCPTTRPSLKIGGWLGIRYFDSLLGRSDALFKKRAAEFREALVELGPAFVKIAQAVSSRPDLIPPAYIAELSLLQDQIAPFSTKAALSIIESELGVPVDVLFSEITPAPVAAASLGQVYQARLRPSGDTVAVKVQRPGVKATISLDIYILRILAGYARIVGRFNTDLQAVVDEWASSLFRVSSLHCFTLYLLSFLCFFSKEMDYEAEARNGERFRRLFGDIPDLTIPKMYKELSSQRVLIMEWVEGQKLSEAKDLRLVEIGTYCSLSQILETGFYHADPHPGNLLCTTDGKLAYIDFGMMGEIKQNFRDAIVEASLHLVNREFDALAGDIVNLGFLPPTAPSAEVSRALTGIFENAVSRGVTNLSFGDLSGKLGQTMFKFKFRIPSYFSLVIRSLTVLEGIAITIDPNYKVLGRSYPWIARKVLTDDSPTLRSTLYNLLYKDGTFQIDRLESLILESSKATANWSLDQATTEALQNRLYTFILSDQGEYVKGVLLDEVVKGIDALNRSTIERLISSLGLSIQGLVDAQDEENLINLVRILALITSTSDSSSKLLKYDRTSTSLVTRTPEFLSLLGDSSEFLKWFSVLVKLPLPLQQKLLLVPLEVTNKLVSRAIARVLRSSL
ncbi:uncharacterized aarF domain-containing protein kinase At1g71810, chloroplastic isoform X2 [Selaginella moellendorffii]|uniref:uncharacterized aarF domain-containing protein kinase At1g71810, chloroplastic isoform X2 n=1 Tax=Selaginella moellendorffii TaxID=88036 RepID=UPI000D1CD88E|nr:uncharacterized aarF domain-containing protein kinase At1g71810, chloroplastic isoform X2 [Selaginella moellendorffii]|eukprot:XP_024528606.1 uncharacterized aarF domain-containing protein kinase At1g71810, chloroplastic isoform X2 [Selaginella moellendorffii]